VPSRPIVQFLSTTVTFVRVPKKVNDFEPRLKPLAVVKATVPVPAVPSDQMIMYSVDAAVTVFTAVAAVGAVGAVLEELAVTYPWPVIVAVIDSP
jgi:hypothetical protein